MARLSDLVAPVATRARSLDFSALGLWLPNPDPILKSQGKDIAVYRDLRVDAHVGGCIRRRKSAVKALQWGLSRGRSPSRVYESVKAILAGLDMERLIGDCLEACLYGYQPLEVIWRRDGALLAPDEVRALPPEWFCFSADGELRFRTRERPLEGEKLPARKFLLPRQDASYANPYGFPDLSMVFWPMVFKKGGTRFWLAFTEKYGMPFLLGKGREGATDEELAALQDNVERMIADATATVPFGTEIDVLEIKSGAASADLYEKLVLHCRSEVSIALLGSNMGMEKDSNRATAGAGLEVANDLRDGDAEIVAAAVNSLIRWICELNFGTVEAPVWSLWDQQARDDLRARRDELLTRSGAKFTNAYWMREYGLEEGDLVSGEPSRDAMANPAETFGSQNPPAAHAAAPAAHAAAHAAHAAAHAAHAAAPTFPDQAAIDGLPDPDAAVLEPLLAPILAELMQGIGPDEMLRRLAEWYPKMDDRALTELLARAMFVAELHGRLAAQRERAPAPVINNYITLPEQPAPAVDPVRQDAHAARLAAEPPVVNVTVQVPEQPAPVVNVVNEVAAPGVTVEVQPAPVNTVVTHPARAIQTVERDPESLEITRTITHYEQE